MELISTLKRVAEPLNWSFPGGSDGKASARTGLIAGSGRSSGKGNGNHSSTLAWKIPWTEEPGRLQSMG